MGTTADKLQAVLDSKEAIKQALEDSGKEPTDTLSSYAGHIEGLENPDQVSYCVTVDGTSKVYAQLYGQEKVTLTATENDIRQNTSAITNAGYTEGTKEIPAYFSSYGRKFIQAGKEATITIHEADYKSLMVTIAPFNSSVDGSTAINYASVDDGMYEAKSASKVADITKDIENETINLGITVAELSVLRYFVVREEG